MTTTVADPLQGLAVELRRQLETKRDLMADTRRTSFSLAQWNRELEEYNHTDVPDMTDEPDDLYGPTELILNIDLPEGAEAFGVTRNAHQQIAEKTSVPWPFYERLMKKHPDLLRDLGNELLSREPSRRMVRTLDGRVRAFMSDGYRPRDNWDLLEQAVLPALAGRPGVEFQKCELTDTHMFVKIRLPEFERPDPTPKVGTVIHGGLIIRNSEVGASSLLVAPYTYQYWCANGCAHDVLGQRQRHVGKRITGDGSSDAWVLYSDETLKLDDEAFFAKTRDVITATLNETVFDLIIEKMGALAGVKIEGDPVAAVEVLAKREYADLGSGEKGSLMQHLIEGGDLSALGYHNALTATARDIEDPTRRTEIEVTAGRLLHGDGAWTKAMAVAG